MFTTPAQGHSRRTDSLYGTHRIAFDTGNLYEAAYRVTGESKVVLHRDLGGIFYLLRRSPQRIRESTCGH